MSGEVQQNEGNREEILELARSFFQENKYRQAEPLLQQLILLNSKSPEVFQMLGTIYYDQGKFNKAVRSFKRALEIDPAYTDASVGLSIILNDLGRYEEGREIFEKAQEVLAQRATIGDPYIEQKLAMKHDELGELYYRYKRYDEALEQYYKALALTQKKTETMMKIVECFSQKGFYDKAVKELKILVKDYPHFIPARLKLGVLYYNANNVLEAIEQWEGILRRDSGHPEALKFLKMAQAVTHEEPNGLVHNGFVEQEL
jgi:tetratricopeptide (TPR) repeat protein